MMTHVTISLNDQELARACVLAQTEGLSVEEWVQEIIRQTALAASEQPRDPLSSKETGS